MIGLWRLSRTLSQTVNHLFLLAGAVFMVVPFLWMIVTSLKGDIEVFTNPGWLPRDPQWRNYRLAWQAAPFGRYFVNSIFVAAATTALQVFTSVLAAFAFARIRFAGRELVFTLFLATMMLPEQVTLVSNYVLLHHLGWLDTYLALIVPWGASAFSIFLLRQFFLTIPQELEDAATIDGCSRLGFLGRIVVPLSKPALTTVTLFAVVGSWNAFVWPLVVTNSEHMRTVQIGIAYFTHQAGTDYTRLMAAATFTIVPMLLLFLAMRRQFVEGIARSGIKE